MHSECPQIVKSVELELLIYVAIKETIAPTSKRIFVHKIIGTKAQRAPISPGLPRLFDFFVQAGVDLAQPVATVWRALSASDVFIHLLCDQSCVNSE